jgi:hypothetical protein
MNGANEVLTATARLLNAVAECIEKGTNPTQAVGEIAGERTAATLPPAPEPTKTRRPRTVKANDPVPEPAPTPSNDPMLGMLGADAPAAPAAPAAATEMSEKESTEKLTEMAKAICQRFPTKGAEDRPEGFHMAKKILADHFGGKSISTLAHGERVKFIGIVKDVIAKADGKVAA